MMLAFADKRSLREHFDDEAVAWAMRERERVDDLVLMALGRSVEYATVGP